MPVAEIDRTQSVVATPPYAWQATDERGVGSAFTQALDRANAHEWKSDATPTSQGTRAADIHALLVGSCWAAANLSLDPPRVVTTANGNRVLYINLDAPFSSDARRAEVVHHAFGGWLSLVRATRPDLLKAIKSPPRTLRVATTDEHMTPGGKATIEQTDAGIAPLAIAGIAAVVIVASGAAAAILFKFGGLADAQREKNYLTLQHERILESQARKDAVLFDHATAEEKAGHELPFTASEKQKLDDAEKERVDAASVIAGAKPAPDSSTGTGIAIGVAGLALLLLYLQRKRG